MKKENLATLIVVATALTISAIFTSCTRERSRSEFNTARISTPLFDKMRISDEGKVYQFIYKRRRYTMFEPYRSGTAVLIHIEEEHEYINELTP